jgi:hypothetical protein
MLRLVLVFASLLLAVGLSTHVPFLQQSKEERQCEACHAVTDSLFYVIHDEIDWYRRNTRAGEQKVLDLKVGEKLRDTCDRLDKDLKYGPHLIAECHEFVSSHNKQLATTFAVEEIQQVPLYYGKKASVCKTVSTGCMDDSESDLSTCDACGVVVKDLLRVLEWGRGRQAFGGKQHVYRALENICEDLHVRHPAKRHDRLRQVCDELLTDYEPEIAEILADVAKGADEDLNPTRAICNDLAGVCKKKKAKRREDL